MKIIIAPDSFKGTLSSSELCEIIKKELLLKCPESEIITLPVADGGEGTLSAFKSFLGGEIVKTTVKSPLLRSIESEYLLTDNNTAVIEMAKASGITIEDRNNALKASSYGTGELILHSVKNGAEKIILGIGGSATTDAGTGCLSALGVRFYDKSGKSISPCGESLCKIASADFSLVDPLVRKAEITVLCDVKNPLYGESGAAFVFAPQKGATKEDVLLLDKGLRTVARVFEKHFCKDYSSTQGSGAAGGMGFAMLSVFGAKLKSGVDCVLDMAGFDLISKHSDLVITGEGKMDSQSLMGKVPFGVAKRSGAKKVVAIVGMCTLKSEEYKAMGIDFVIETNPLHLPFEEIKPKAKEMLIKAIEQLVRS